MGSWWPIVMLMLGAFFVGGVISFARQRIYVLAIGCGVATVLCFIAAYVWWGVT